MRMLLLAAMLIALPAVAVVAAFWGTVPMLPALASLTIAALPFIAGAYLFKVLRGEADDEISH